MKKIIFSFLLFLLFIPITVNATLDDTNTIIRLFDDEFNQESLESSVILDDGGFIVTGYYYAASNGRTDLGTFTEYVGIVMRYDKNGNLLWEKAIENTTKLYDVALTPDNNIIVVGDYAIVKLNLDGEILDSVFRQDINLYNVVVDDNGIIYTSSMQALAKLSSDFELIDMKEYSSNSYIEDIMLYDNDIIVFGRTYSSNNNYPFMDRLKSDLTEVWSKYLDLNYATSVAKLNDKIIVSTYNTVGLFDSNGELLWSTHYGNGSFTHIDTMGVTSNNTIMAFGHEAFDNENLIQIFVLEYSLEGELLDKQVYYDTAYIVEKPECLYNDTDCACGGMMTSNRGFVLTGYTAKKDNNYNPEDDTNYKGQYYGYIIYNTIPKKYNIYTKTDGNGSIEVIDSAAGGDSISFKAQALGAYKLASITVTTDNGESIKFTEDDITKDESGLYSISTNSFIMPYSDVTIEAKWSKDSSDLINPNTGTGLVIILSVSLLVICLVYFIKYKHKIVKI